MKKIIATMLTLVLLALLCAVPAGAETAEPELDRDQLEKLFLAYCRQTQYEGIPQGDNVTIDEIVEIDGVYLFTGRYSEHKEMNYPFSQSFGEYRLYRDSRYDGLGIYAYYKDEVTPNVINQNGYEVSAVILEHYLWFIDVLKNNSDLIDFEGITVIRQLYNDEVRACLEERYKNSASDEEQSLSKAVFYEELLCYYGDSASTDESEPEYVLFKVFAEEMKRPPSYILGEYAVYPGHVVWGDSNCWYYGVYVPEEDKVYTVEEAYNADLSGIKAIFEEKLFPCGLIGDVDGDKELTVKDATNLQKYLADLDFKTDNYALTVSWVDLKDVLFDFNRDGKRDVKVATAIQKHIAGLL